MLQYRSDPICYLSKFNYKVSAMIGPDVSSLRPHLTVLDTGAGPNLIRADLLPEQVISKINRSREIINLSSASNHKIDVLGTTLLTVKVGDQLTRTQFVVVRNLGADVILGCQYIDSAVAALNVNHRSLTLRNDDIVPILRRRAIPPSCESSTESKILFPRAFSSLASIRCASRTTILPGHEHLVEVQAGLRGLYFAETSQVIFERHKISIAPGLVEMRPGVPFFIKVANFSRIPVVLVKNMRLGHLVRAPLTGKVLAVKFSDECDQDPNVFASPDENSASTNSTTTSIDDVDLSELSAEHQQRVRAALGPYSSMWDGHVGYVGSAKHQIKLAENTRPFFSHPYRAGPEARKIIQQHVDELLGQDVIEPSKSPWASPVVLAEKADGTKRFCVDYRRLNAATIKDRYPIPRMEDCLDSLGDCKYFTTLDCNSGFWQIPIAEEDRYKSAFTCHAGKYQWKRMPFGLCNAPATYQRSIDILLSGFKWKSCLVYLDDIIIYSRSFDDHLSHVVEILDTLASNGLTLKLRKCHFFKSSVDYLGHVIRPGYLEVAEKNTEAVRKAVYPRTQTELKSFLGSCNVYRRFIPNFARVAAPLNSLLRKGEAFRLPSPNEEQTEAFETLRSSLISPPILRLPQEGQEFSVDTDACDKQIGCALMQVQEDGKRYPIGFWSRSLTAPERNYSASERECLAVVWAVQLLRPYLEHKHFVLFTDHQALRWIFDLSDLHGRLGRWRLRLLQYDFTVKYRKGADNVIADCISRLPTFGYSPINIEEDIPCMLIYQSNTEGPTDRRLKNIPLQYKVDKTSWSKNDWDPVSDDENLSPAKSYAWYSVLATNSYRGDSVSLVTIDQIRKAQHDDQDCQRVQKRIEEGVRTPYIEDERGLLVRISPKDGAVQILVPKELRQKVLFLAHYTPVAGHPGVSKQYYTMRQTFYWPSMFHDIQQASINCHECAMERVKLRAHKSPMKLFPATEPLEFVAIDLLGPLLRSSTGHRFILVITDRFSKLVRAVPLKNIRGLTVARAFLENWILQYGAPLRLLSDNGTQFTAKLFQYMCERLGVSNLFTTTYHPQTNGQTERFNRTLLASLRAFVAEHPKSWDEYVGPLVYAYNTQVHSTTGLPPFNLVLTKPPKPMIIRRETTHEIPCEPREARARFKAQIARMVQETKSNSERIQRRMKQNFDNRVKPTRLIRKNDFVYLENVSTEYSKDTGVRNRHKLSRKATGPYMVIDESSHTVTIDRDGLNETVSRDRVTLAPRPDKATTSDSVPQILKRQKPPEARENDSTPGHQSMDETGKEYVIEKIVDYDEEEMLFRVNWTGYTSEQDTWEPPGALPFNQIARYFRRTRRQIPRGMRELCSK